MPQRRDYKAEYERRRASALRRGLSLSQARGHPREHEAYASAKPEPAYDEALERALRFLRRTGSSLAQAANEKQVRSERLARYAKRAAGAHYSDGRWSFTDVRHRRIGIVEAGIERPAKFKVAGFEPAHRAGLHWYEAGKALLDQTLAPDFQRRWDGQGIRDVQGRWQPFSTDLNQLYRAVHGHDYGFDNFYLIQGQEGF